ncbi:GAF domain-containing protein [Leptolyngbya sp. 7M]|uniref:GAF domain-containing protein n=1 Tax=Leptolyngbya sp. 7M TaxID=2812896 RepID=UPI001B8ADD3C|nr:GAF domain-containing protein [Leptolyngbya sp. 7M]QYO68028.1 GAF domain-containing protein [Leptolyngbya sp. 7M]
MDQLQKAEQTYHLLDLMPIGACVLDSDYRVLFWNACLEQWTNLPRTKIIGHGIGSYFPVFNQPEYQALLQSIFLGQKTKLSLKQLLPLFLPHLAVTHQCQITITAVPSPQSEGYEALLSIQAVAVSSSADEQPIPAGSPATPNPVTPFANLPSENSCEAEQAADSRSAGSLVQQLRRRTHLLEQITAAMRQSLDTQKIFQMTVTQIGRAFEVNRCLIHSYTSNPAPQLSVISEYVEPGYDATCNLQIPVANNTYVARLLAGDQAIASADVTTEPLLHGMVQVCHRYRIRSLLAVRTSYQGEANGVISLQQCHRVRHWTADEVDLLEAVAAQVGVVIAQARLLDQERRQRQELTLKNAALEQARWEAEASNQAKSNFLATMSHEIRTFAGTPGTGRGLAARCFAELLLARDPREEISPTLRQRIQQGNHPDLLWVEPTYLHQGKLISAAEAAELGIKRRTPPEIRIDQIREVSRFLSRPPLEAPRSVVVLEQADSMTEAAANSLLKTLEEPGAATLILIAPSPDSLLPTLVSRCQRIPFQRLDQSAMGQILRQTGQTELLEHPEILALAQGSPGEAITHWHYLQNVPPELLEQLIHLPTSLRSILELARQVDQTLEPDTQLWLLDYLQHCYWQRGQSARLPLLENARRYLRRYVQPRLVWEVSLLQISQAGST